MQVNKPPFTVFITTLSKIHLKYMASFSTKTQIINQLLNKPFIPAVTPQTLPRPQIPPNTPTENFAELEKQVAKYFFQLVLLYPFSFRQHN